MTDENDHSQDGLSCSFPPIVGHAPHTLILGTMPGQKSLAAGQYYAHPQNQFWRLIGDLYGIDRALPYDLRAQKLTECGIAVWDVVQSCRREGSMDADIRDAIPHDFAGFFARHPTVRRVVFDSLKAEQLYTRLVLPDLDHSADYARVPSPSPAYASLSYAQKLAAWKRIL